MIVMATQNGTGESLEPLTYKTWMLKVSIHCQGCKRKVHKVLHDVEGVYTINIDAKQHKVIVTGNVEADTLIRKLIKSGKQAELWPEPAPEPKEKKSKKSKKKDKEKEGDSTSEEEDDDEDDEQNDNNTPDVDKHPVKVEVVPDPSGKFSGLGVMMVAGGSGNQLQSVTDKKEGENVGGMDKPKKKKKKKKKGNKTVTMAESSGGGGPTGSIIPQDHYPSPPQINLGPPSPYGYHQFPSHYHLPTPSPMPSPMYAVNYNTNNPNTGYSTKYYAAPQPPSYAPNIGHNTTYYNASPPRYSYGHAHYEVESPPSDSEYYQRRSSDSLELLSEENPNGCSIM